MSSIKLPKRHGFGQRHYVNPRPTPFLPDCSAGKFWRSPVTVNAIREDVLKFGNATVRPNDADLDYAIFLAFRAFKLPIPVPMLHLCDVFRQHDLEIWKSSPGLPWKDYGFRTKNEVRRDPDAVQSIRRFYHFMKIGRRVNFPDACAFVRSHVVEYGEQKIRAVWGYPATITFGEAMFAVPLIRAYQVHRTPFAYGYETATGGTARLVRELSSKHKTALDFKGFDKTVPAWLIRVCCDILATNIDFGKYQDYGVANADRLIYVYSRLVNYLINTPIRLCTGERYLKRSGIASGSYFTQLVGGIANYILITWCCIKQHQSPPEYIRVLGDDSIIGTERPFSLDAAMLLMETVGMEVNVQKSVTSQFTSNLTFLGYNIGHGVPTKPYDRWLVALLFPERPDRDWDDVASRALGLLYACAGCDDRFDSLCRTIVRLRPYNLRLSTGISRMLRMIGVYDLDPDPPPKMVLWKRLGLF